MYHLPAAKLQVQWPYLKEFISHGMVLELKQRQFQISQKGFLALRAHSHSQRSSRVLEPRLIMPLEDRSHWGVMLALGCDGWTGETMPRKTPLPISTSSALTPAQKKWYFSGTKLDVSFSSLCCRLQRSDLASKGQGLLVLSLMHFLDFVKLKISAPGVICTAYRQLVAYYDGLLGRSKHKELKIIDDSPLESLCDNAAKRPKATTTRRSQTRNLSSNPMLAIEDGAVDAASSHDEASEGEPDAEPSFHAPHSHITGTWVDPARSVTIAGFKFSWVWRRRRIPVLQLCSRSLVVVPTLLCETHGLKIYRHDMSAMVKKIPGAVVTDSRGVYDAACSSESPQKGLRSSQAGMELEYSCQRVLQSGTVLRWNRGGAMLKLRPQLASPPPSPLWGGANVNHCFFN